MVKKGYDFITSGKSFNSEDAVVALGVGKNMVSSIRFWMKAFDMIDNNDKPTVLANKLLAENGWDPYMEDEATLWLLHYHLVKKGLASIYSLIFNELRKEKIEFTKSNLTSFIKRKTESLGISQVNDKTLADDFGVMVKMYIRSDAQSKDKEDSFSGVLTELDLVKCIGKRNNEDNFIIENTEKPEIPDEVILYSILDFSGTDLSVNVSSIEQESNGTGTIFAIDRTGLQNKIESIVSKNRDIIYTNHAGIRELQFKKKPSPFDVLKRYYAN